jgi:hypothetical protein
MMPRWRGASRSSDEARGLCGVVSRAPRTTGEDARYSFDGSVEDEGLRPLFAFAFAFAFAIRIRSIAFDRVPPRAAGKSSSLGSASDWKHPGPRNSFPRLPRARVALPFVEAPLVTRMSAPTNAIHPPGAVDAFFGRWERNLGLLASQPERTISIYSGGRRNQEESTVVSMFFRSSA